MGDHLQGVRERRAGLRAAVGRVEGTLATPARGRAEQWAKDLGAELEDLAVSLDLHIATTEAADGLLADIIETAPRLAHRVERVRHDHETLRHHLEAARAALPHDDDGVQEARDRAVDLLTAIVRHRHLGAELVYDAYNVDLEAAD